jgi:hypothetical protein
MKSRGVSSAFILRMKSLPLLFASAFASLVLAQDPVPPADSAPVPAQPAPLPVEPAPPPSQANPAELPPLPDPSPTGEAGELLRNQPGSRVKPAPQAEPSMVPEFIPGARGSRERPKTRSTLRPPTTSAELDARIRFRQAHSRASSDPKIQELWEESRRVPTDGQKRDALRRYYTLLYKRMLSIDRGIAALVQERQRVSLHRLDQTRIEPTDPLYEEHQQRRY